MQMHATSSALAHSSVLSRQGPICVQSRGLQPYLSCGFHKRLPAVCVRAESQEGHGVPRRHSHSPLTQDDIKRRRLRFGDRPTWTGQQQRQDQEPGTLQQLKSAGDAPALIAASWRQLVSRTNNFLGRKLYEYFNWRQDTSKDLLVTFGVFSMLVLAAAFVRRWGVDEPTERAMGNLWADVYQVCQWVFGQEFPGPEAPLGQQVMSVGTAMVGLAAFAMVLALVEQVVLETLEANVKRGSKVFETGHILVLGWCVSQRDMEVVRKVVQQVCVAHAPEGGTTVVVMTQRSKLEMEAMFWRCLPESQRYGTKLVFRQGSPLVPSDLRLVGASRAAATIVVSDQSRSAPEADAQAVRCAILLDELECDMDMPTTAPLLTAMAAASTSDGGDLPSQLDLSLLGRHVVVELKTANAMPLLKYACSSRVMALPTNQLNAQRMAKMVKRPVISIISQQLFNFENGVTLFVHYYPHLVGSRFGDLAFLFPDGIVMGLVDRATGKARMAPSKDCLVQPTHALVVCRPTTISSHEYAPLAAPPSTADLKLQEALATWVCPQLHSARGNGWPLDVTPVSTFDAEAAAKQRVAGTATGTAIAAATNVSITGKSSADAVCPWDSSVSQIELLKQQVEAASRYSDGQPSLASVESSAGGAAPLQAGPAQLANNIVPMPHLSSSQTSAVSDPMQPAVVAAAAVPRVAVASTAGAGSPSKARAVVPAHAVNTASSTTSAIDSNSSPAVAQQALQALGSPRSVHTAGGATMPFSYRPVLFNRSAVGKDSNSKGSQVSREPVPFRGIDSASSMSSTDSGPVVAQEASTSSTSTRVAPDSPGSPQSRAGATMPFSKRPVLYNRSAVTVDSASSTGKGAALHTTDWPVLSGAHEHPAGKPLWRRQRDTSQPRQQASTSRQGRKPLSRTVEQVVNGWASGFAADSVEGGTTVQQLAGRISAASAAGMLNDAAVLVPPEYFAVDERPEKVCVLGWGPHSLMVDLVKELDHGLSALPKGSEVVFVNMHNPHDSLGKVLQHITLENVQVRHVSADPLQRSSLASTLDVSQFRCAMVLCDESWVDPDNNDANGLDSLDEPSVLRLDSLVMVAQLNMRKLLEDSKLPAINCISQKVATEGLTRFEDRHRLPLGISVNLNNFAAKMLAQIAANPLMLAPVTRLGEDAMLTTVDSSHFAALGEELNFWQLMARCQMAGDVLLGYYEIPEHLDEPLNTVVNPIGLQVRRTPQVWNKGDGRLKFILLCHKQYRHGSTSGSHDDMELENTKQAGWVAARERSPHVSTQGSAHGSHASHPGSFTDAQ